MGLAMTDLGAAGYDGVLELRIHGVNNTSPSSMLDLGVDDVELVPHIGGDESAGFWRAKEAVRDRLDPLDRGYTPEGLTREAYSWGGLARTSPDGFGFGSIKAITGVLGRLAWIMLIPFGLVNIAYWSRRLPERPYEPPSKDAKGSPDEVQGDPPSEEKKTRATGVWSGRGSASIRIFALGSTMLLVVSVCDVALDVVARQCYRGGVPVCGGLPSQLDSVATWSLAQRLAAVSIVPVLLLLLLWWVIGSSRTRYEKVVAQYTPTEAARIVPEGGGKETAGPPELDLMKAGEEASAGDLDGGPHLTARRLWSGDRLVGRALSLHLAAALVVVAMSTSWAASVGPGPKCRTIETTMHGCWAQLNKQPYSVIPFFRLTVVALLILLVVAAALVATADDAPDVQHRSDQDQAGLVLRTLRHHRTSTGVLAGAFVTFAAEAVLLAKVPVTIDENRDLPGLLLLPMVLVAGMLGIAMSALAWRNATLWTKRALRLLPVGLGLAFGVLLLTARWWRGWYAAAGAVALALTIILLVSPIGRKEGRSERRKERERTAWHGMAPGVFLMLSLAVSMLLSSLVTVTSGDWLNNGRSASTLISGVSRIPLPQTSRPCLLTCQKPPPDPVLIVPTAYVWFGVMSLVTLVVMLGFFLFLLVVARGGDRLKPAPETGQLERIDAKVKWSAALGLELERRKARGFASITHRAEILVGVLALFSGLAASSSVLVSASLWHPPAAGGSFLGDVIGLAVVGVALAGLTLVGALVGGKVVGGGRPLGLLWDLMCFLPRAGHPFGPPCYAERAVPDLLSRCKNWLGTDVQDTAIPGRRVVLSAHSLGSVLAAATVFNFRKPEPGLSLLTYGSQLRGYFSRLLPELLGPTVLGVTPCIGSITLGPDPWRADTAKQLDPLGEGEVTLRARLTGSGIPVARDQAGQTPEGARLDPRWVSLWRRTDYIGFPVFSYPALPADSGGVDSAVRGAKPPPEPPPNVIDRAADERDTTGTFVTVATHGDYPRAPQYQAALDELLARNHRPAMPPRT
jgi:hypothetical protein